MSGNEESGIKCQHDFAHHPPVSVLPVYQLSHTAVVFSPQVFAYDYCFWSMDETDKDKFAG